MSESRMSQSRANWKLEDYQHAIAHCRKKAAAARLTADGWDQRAEELRKESAKFSTVKLPLFKE